MILYTRHFICLIFGVKMDNRTAELLVSAFEDVKGVLDKQPTGDQITELTHQLKTLNAHLGTLTSTKNGGFLTTLNGLCDRLIQSMGQLAQALRR